MNERKLIDKDEALQFRADNGSLHTLKVTNDGQLYFEQAEGAPSTDAVAMWKASSYDGSSQLLKDISGNGHHLKFGSSHPAYITNGYLVLPGQAGNYASTPDSAAVSITGDIDIRVKVALDDWTPNATQQFISKQNASVSWQFAVTSTGHLRFGFSTDGTFGAFNSPNSTAVTGITDGEAAWVRVTRSSSSGNITFYTSANGSSWTQLGTTVSAVSGAIFDGTAPVEIGSVGDGALNMASGRFYWAELRNGIDGPVVAKFDPSSQVDLTTSWSASTGETWTINSAASTDGSDPLFLEYSGTKYLYLPGVAGNDMRIAHQPALNTTGDLDIRVKVAMDDWTPETVERALVGKWGGGASRSWYLRVQKDGKLRLTWTPDGVHTSRIETDSTAAVGAADGSIKWVRCTLDADNGAGGADTKFYTSDDGTSWTQLGSTVTTVGVTTVFAGTDDVYVGQVADVLQPAAKFYRVLVYGSLDGSNKMFDIDTSGISPTATSFTEGTGKTVTIRRSTSGRKSVVVDRDLFLFGADDYMEAVDNDQLDFGTNDSFTVVGVFRAYGTSGAQALIAKAIGSIATGWSCVFNMSSGTLTARLHDGTVTDFDTQTGLTTGAVSITSMVRNVATDSITAYLNGGTSGSTTDPTSASLSNAEALRIGRFSGTGISYADMEFIGAAIWRRALTDEEISYLTGEFGA